MTVCPSCGAPLPPEAFDGMLGLAQCPACGEIAEVQPEAAPEPEPEPDESAWFEEPASGYAEPVPTPRPDTPPRPLVRIGDGSDHGWFDQSDSQVRLVKPWLDSGAWGLAIFAVVWNGFIFAGLVGGATGILCTPHAWIGIAIGYYCVAAFINETTITWDGGVLKVAHGPLPWWGARALPRSGIHQICAKISGVKVNKQSRWNLVAVAPDGTEQVLVRLLKSPDEARWLERRLEDAMGIVDRPVPGEV